MLAFSTPQHGCGCGFLSRQVVFFSPQQLRLVGISLCRSHGFQNLPGQSSKHRQCGGYPAVPADLFPFLKLTVPAASVPFRFSSWRSIRGPAALLWIV